jgi:hypothetical protein
MQYNVISADGHVDLRFMPGFLSFRLIYSNLRIERATRSSKALCCHCITSTARPSPLSHTLPPRS